MSDMFLALDYDRSPYTGWTRAHWEHILARMTYGYARIAERSGSPARVLYPDDRRGLPDPVDAIESFARIASAWGAWLRNPANPAILTFNDREMDLETLLHRALWEHILARMTYGYARIAERSGSPARVLYPDDRRGLPDPVDAIESFARIASAWGAWLRNPANPAILTFNDREMDLETLLHRALL